MNDAFTGIVDGLHDDEIAADNGLLIYRYYSRPLCAKYHSDGSNWGLAICRFANLRFPLPEKLAHVGIAGGESEHDRQHYKNSQVYQPNSH